VSAVEPSGTLESLRGELEALRAERETLERDLAELRLEAERVKAEGDEQVRARVARGRTRRSLAWVGGTLSLIVAALIAIAHVRHVEPERLTGTVREVRGALPIEVGASCVATTDWLLGPRNAALRVDCGGLRLYGSESSGAADCTVGEAHQALSCTDSARIARDGDPRLALDRAERRLVVDDAQWAVEIALDDPR